MYNAHIRKDGKTQSVDDHLHGTAERCAAFASVFGEEARGRLLGTAHDIGKCSDAFQKRLHGGKRVDHATAGGLECAKIFEDLAACCIVGHHSGLPDYGNPRVDAAGATDFFTYALWTRMLYSCLVDADYLDTEAFMLDDPPSRGGYDPLPVLLERLDAHIQSFFPGQSPLDRNRCAILRQCIDDAAQPRVIYTLTVPTGGGKTISSLAFALRHAVTHGLDRVIYVIPYTSIIEQNAAVFRKILGDRNVVEHHSGVQFDDAEETNPDNLFQRLAAENWDAPVIVTTAVQFFESLYANRSSQCRKLHNIANSVIIFDEAQMLPTCHLKPCVGVIANLVSHFRCTALLCTATQPVLSDLFHAFSPELVLRPLCSKALIDPQAFRRVTYRNGGILSDEALAEALWSHAQVLCVVNTRRAAQILYDLLPPEGRFHLSTLMYPAHRRAVLDTIRSRLEDGLPCRVISTSLIEAGVDVSFPAVFREIAGLDSIVQAAGRCNRAGKGAAEDHIVTYFRGEHPVPLLQKLNIHAAQEALENGGAPDDPETITRYFSILRTLMCDQTDKQEVVKALREGLSGCLLPFETVAHRFHLIDQASCTIYIPIGEGESLCQKLLDKTANREDYRRAGQFSVSVYEQHFRALAAAGDILPLSETEAVLTNPALYDPDMGLSLEADPGKAEFI